MQYLEDNDKLIQAILENLNAGRIQDGMLYVLVFCGYPLQETCSLAAIDVLKPEPMCICA